MIRGASLLKDTESGSSPPELDEFRAELIKQKILFEAELRRQREVSDERFVSMARQLQAVLDDNAQLRRTLHAMGDRVQIVEHQLQNTQTQQHSAQQQINGLKERERERANTASRGRSSSPHPVVVPQHVLIHNLQQQQENNNINRKTTTTPTPTPNNFNQLKVRQNSPVPYSRTNTANQNNQHAIQVHGANHQFVKIKPSPTTTPAESRQETPRTSRQVQPQQQQQFSRQGSNVSNNNNQTSAVIVTSPAHIQFRPVLRSNNVSHHHQQPISNQMNNNTNPFKSPMRNQSELSQIGKQQIAHSQRWK
jgi:hypothetical protein